MKNNTTHGNSNQKYFPKVSERPHVIILRIIASISHDEPTEGAECYVCFEAKIYGRLNIAKCVLSNVGAQSSI